jgi:phenylacetate-coenzyme A ligase PaaK-like adenylate-forming protein
VIADRVGEMGVLWDLFRSRRTSRAEIVAFQQRQLRRLIRHAGRHVPYYRRLFARAEFTPDQFQSLSDLRRIPITERGDIRSLPASEVCAEGLPIERLRVVHTSGSTGTPVTIRRTNMEENLLLGYRVRAAGEYGLGLWTRRVQLDYFSAHTLQAEGRPRVWERLGILPRLLVDWTTPKEQIVKLVEGFRADVLSGPPSVLSWLADEFTDEDRRRMGFQLTIMGAETSTALMRRQIERGYGAPLAELYGSHEVVFIAMQRPGGDDYRVCEEAVYFEVLKDGRPAEPGERGEVVVTALHSFAMPFIRYRLGDEVTLGDPPDDARDPYLTIRSIDGRIIDRFVFADGRVYHPYSLKEAFHDVEDVRSFQIVQTDPDRVLVRLVLYGNEREATNRIEAGLREMLGADVAVQLEVTDSLQPAAGKFRPYVSMAQFRASDPADYRGRTTGSARPGA